MSNRLNQDREAKLQPTRMQKAKDEITKLGYVIELESDTDIVFQFKGATIQYFAYSGWHTGRTIKDGRGLQKLLNQIKP